MARRCARSHHGTSASPPSSTGPRRVTDRDQQPPGRETRHRLNVYTIKPNGSDLTQLTHETKPGVHALADSFFPDGKHIIYAKNIGPGEGGFQVCVMNTNGTGKQQLTHGVDAHWASWGSHP